MDRMREAVQIYRDDLDRIHKETIMDRVAELEEGVREIVRIRRNTSLGSKELRADLMVAKANELLKRRIA